MFFFSRLAIPTSKHLHAQNFDRIVTTLKHVVNHRDLLTKNNPSKIYFYFNKDDCGSSSGYALYSHLSIEYIAQYYSEILSNVSTFQSTVTTTAAHDPHSITDMIMSSVIVLPPPSTVPPLPWLTNKMSNEQKSLQEFYWSQYIECQRSIAKQKKMTTSDADDELSKVVFLQFDTNEKQVVSQEQEGTSEWLNHVCQQVDNCTVETVSIDNDATQQLHKDSEDEESFWSKWYPYPVSNSETKDSYAQFRVVCLGGTFDRLHIGHQLMLTCLAMILNLSDANAKFVVGLSGDALLKNKTHRELIQSYELRKTNLINMLKTVHMGVSVYPNDDPIFKIKELNNPYGPSTTEPIIDALVISEETRKGGDSVNKVRTQEGMPPARLICIPVVQARNNTEKLSSTHLRQRDAQRMKE